MTPKKLYLNLRVILSDIIRVLSPFKIYCHLFYCKRGFNVAGRCQYCTRFFVDSPRTLSDIERNMTYIKSESNENMVRHLNSGIFRLNVNYVSVVRSVNNNVVLTNTLNFGIIHYDSISSPMALYIFFYFEIYVRVYMNIMRKHVLKEIFRNLLSKSIKDELVKYYSRQFSSQASHHARKLVSYLNLSISKEDFEYVYENIDDYSAFIKILK